MMITLILFTWESVWEGEGGGGGGGWRSVGGDNDNQIAHASERELRCYTDASLPPCICIQPPWDLPKIRVLSLRPRNVAHNITMTRHCHQASFWC